MGNDMDTSKMIFVFGSNGFPRLPNSGELSPEPNLSIELLASTR